MLQVHESYSNGSDRTSTLTGLLTLWLQADDRRVKICHTLALVLQAADDLLSMLTERSSGLEAGPMPQPGPAASHMPILTLASAEPFADCEGMDVNVHATGRRQEASASSEGSGSGFCMPDSRADGPQCPGAALRWPATFPRIMVTRRLTMICWERTQMTCLTMSQTRCQGLPHGLPGWGLVCLHIGRAVVQANEEQSWLSQTTLRCAASRLQSCNTSCALCKSSGLACLMCRFSHSANLRRK